MYVALKAASKHRQIKQPLNPMTIGKRQNSRNTIVSSDNLTEACFSTNTIDNQRVDIVANAGNTDVGGCQDEWKTTFESKTLVEEYRIV